MGVTPTCSADREQLARTARLARFRSTTSCGGLATMYGLPSCSGLVHPAPAVVEHSRVFGPLGRDPAVQGDHADDLQPRVGQRRFSSASVPPSSR